MIGSSLLGFWTDRADTHSVQVLLGRAVLLRARARVPGVQMRAAFECKEDVRSYFSSTAVTSRLEVRVLGLG